MAEEADGAAYDHATATGYARPQNEESLRRAEDLQAERDAKYVRQQNEYIAEYNKKGMEEATKWTALVV